MKHIHAKLTFILVFTSLLFSSIGCANNGASSKKTDNKNFASEKELWEFIQSYRYSNLKEMWGEGEIGEPWDASGVGEFKMKIYVKWKDVKCIGKSVKVNFENDFTDIGEAFEKSPGSVQSYELY